MSKLLKLADKFAQQSTHWTERAQQRTPEPGPKGPEPGLEEYELGDFNKLKSLAQEEINLKRDLEIYTNKVNARLHVVLQNWQMIVKRNKLSTEEINQILSSSHI